MTNFGPWLSPEVIRPLGLALLHFLWQGLALAAVASAGMAVCRRASVRYAIGVICLALMVSAPVITFFSVRDTNPDSSWKAAAVFISTPRTVPTVSRSVQVQAGSSMPADALLWLVDAWFAGVILLGLRTTGGLLLVARMRRRQATPFTAELLRKCMDLQRRLGLNRAIRYCTCRWLETPSVIGWVRPIIFLPLAALTGMSEEQLEAVIAHELAHVKRLDPFVNLFQVATETLLFYHPAVWWLSRRIRAERENCCDDMAISVCGNTVAYARALALMAEWQAGPAMAITATGSSLGARIRRLLGVRRLGGGLRSVGLVAGVAAVTAAVVIAAAIFGGVHAAPVQSQTPVPSAQAPVSNSGPKTKPSAKRPAASQGSAEEITSDSYIEGMKAAGLENLTVDELVSLKIQGVTPEYVRGIHEQGLKAGPEDLASLRVQGITPEYVRDLRVAGLALTTDRVIGLKVQGVSPEYVQELQKLGLHNDPDELIGMKVQGVTPEYIRELRALELDPRTDEIIGLKVQGVTPDYVQELRKLGLKGDVGEIIGMKVQGVTPDYIRELRSLGVGAGAEQIVGMKVQGITPDYVRGLQEQGLHPDSGDLIGMKVQGVTPEYVREMRALGFTLNAEQLVALRVQGVTPEYAKALQAAGLKLDADGLIAAKVQGITPEFVEKVRSHGFKDLDLDKLIKIKQAGILDEQADI